MTTAGQIGSALTPLRERYAHWLKLDAQQVLDDREEAAQDIRAMQLVLRMERLHPPSWHRALAAAATGAAALCVDPRSEPGGEWHDALAEYCRGHIRKVTRRARGAHWFAAQELPGITVDIDGTQVRALLPGRVTELDPRVSRLQVGGTDVPPDQPVDAAALDPAALDPAALDAAALDAAALDPAALDPAALDPAARAEAVPAAAAAPADPTLTVWLAAGAAMTLGKAMAQAGHAGMIAVSLLAGDDQPALQRWAAAGCPAAAGRATTNAWNSLTDRLTDQAAAWRTSRLLAVRDAGFTEVEPGAVTVIARAPRAG